MQNPEAEHDEMPLVPPGTPAHELTGEQIAAIGQRAVRRLIAEGKIKGPAIAPRPNEMIYFDGRDQEEA